METTPQFMEWLAKNLGSLGASRPGTWVAVDDTPKVIDEDRNGNVLIDRIAQLANRETVHIVYAFPPEFQ